MQFALGRKRVCSWGPAVRDSLLCSSNESLVAIINLLLVDPPSLRFGATLGGMRVDAPTRLIQENAFEERWPARSAFLRQHYLDQVPRVFGVPRPNLSAFVVPADGRLAPE